MNTPHHLLTKTCTITNPTIGEHTTGVPTVSYASGSVTVMGNLQADTSTEAFLLGRDTGQTFWTLLLAPATTAGAAYTVQQLARVTIDATNYFVEGPGQDVAGQGVLTRVRLRRDQ